MCGIFAVLNTKEQIDDILLSALYKLEYRGYDSAGISYIDNNNNLFTIKSIGKINALETKIKKATITGEIGIGHTRWATHGKITLQNAHPHTSSGISIVHNGIVENYIELREYLFARGMSFYGETDSEVIAKLIDIYTSDGMSFFDAVQATTRQIQGTYAIVAINKQFPTTLIGAKKNSPLVIGLTHNKASIYIASDAIALANIADEIIYLEDGDIINIQKNKLIDFQIFNSQSNAIARQILPNLISEQNIDKNGFENFMLKEIYEEPSVVLNTFHNQHSKIDIKKYKNIVFIACGTSYYAGYVAKYWIEDLLQIHVDVEIASEFRYRNPILSKDTIYIFISQSGETLDTLCALKLAQEKNLNTLALVNIETSSIARTAKSFIKTMAGVEIGVASTKTFIAQIISILLLAIDKKQINANKIAETMQSVLDNQSEIQIAAEKLYNCKNVIYLGRGISFPIALEGALKIKEIAYINAQAYPAGEFKHGPIALIDQNTYSVILAPKNTFLDKTLSNTQEILSRNGAVIIISTEDAKTQIDNVFKNQNVFCIFLPNIEPLLLPFLLTIAVHLLAYHTGKILNLDVDKPRNLAKSVTVE